MPEQLRPLEIAAGIAIGDGPVPAVETTAADPAAALIDATLPALQRPPCLVSFSGGTDSSIVLAAATTAARRHGLDDPVPITWRFPDAPRSEESAWQEAVIAELGVRDWLRLTATDELDVAGPVARGVLARHRLVYPHNAHFHVPLLERARGGALLTGVGGDEVLGGWRWRALADARAGRRRRTPRDALRAGLAHAPALLRRRRLQPTLDAPWLTDAGRRAAQRAFAAQAAGEPDRWDRRVVWQAARRRVTLTVASFGALARDAESEVHHPLLDVRLLGALVRLGGRDGLGDRRAVLREALGSVFPDAIRDRDRKALFDEVFWTGGARRFGAEWDGSGLDPEWLDADKLRVEWERDRPSSATALALQEAIRNTDLIALRSCP